MSDREHLGQPKAITLDWYGSKEVLHDFVHGLFEEAREINEEFAAACYKTILLPPIYDMAHRERGLEDFPRLINIEYFPGLKDGEGSIDCERLLVRIADELEGCINGRPVDPQNKFSYNYEKEVRGLRQLAALHQGDIVQVKLQESYNKGYVLKQIG